MSGLARKLYNYFTGGKAKESSSGCSVPSKIYLEPSKKITVGQEPAAPGTNCVYSFSSEKLPHISKQHALFAFSKEQKQWMLMDLKSLNGVFVNSQRIKVQEATLLNNNDEISFGNMPSSVKLVYKFVVMDCDRALLEKCVVSSAGTKSCNSADTTERILSASVRTSAREHPQARKIPKVDHSMTCTSSVSSPLLTQSHASALAASSTVSPNMACTSVSSSLFTQPALASTSVKDGEKSQLLSNIEALKTELAAKNEIISKQEQDKQCTDDANSIMSSMREEFTCAICQELFITPYTLPCSHSFCECCIKEWIKQSKICPVCRKRIKSKPVYSLVLSNAVATVESKLSTSEKDDRESLKEEHRLRRQATTASSDDEISDVCEIDSETWMGSLDSDSEHSEISTISSVSTVSTDSIISTDDSSLSTAISESTTMSTNSSISDYDSTSFDESDDISSEDDENEDGNYSFYYYGGSMRCGNCDAFGHIRAQCPYFY